MSDTTSIRADVRDGVASVSSDAEAIRDLFEQTSPGSPDNAVGFVLWRVMHRYQRVLERALAPHDLTHLQFTTLAMVG